MRNIILQLTTILSCIYAGQIFSYRSIDDTCATHERQHAEEVMLRKYTTIECFDPSDKRDASVLQQRYCELEYMRNDPVFFNGSKLELINFSFEAPWTTIEAAGGTDGNRISTIQEQCEWQGKHSARCFVALHPQRKKPIGMAYLVLGQGNCTITHLMVAEQFRRRGIGRQLVERALDLSLYPVQVREKVAKCCAAAFLTRNLVARKFFASLGFNDMPDKESGDQIRCIFLPMKQ